MKSSNGNSSSWGAPLGSLHAAGRREHGGQREGAGQEGRAHRDPLWDGWWVEPCILSSSAGPWQTRFPARARAVGRNRFLGQPGMPSRSKVAPKDAS